MLNNKEYGALKSFSKLLKAEQPFPGVDLPGIDFAALAKGFGIERIHIESSANLKTELVKALLVDAPVLAEIAIDPKTGGAFLPCAYA